MAPYSDDDDNESEEEEEEEEEDDDEVEEEEVPAAKGKRTSKKAWKDPNKPKRAMSAFFLYSQAYRTKTKESNPEASFGDIARLLAKQFKELPEKEVRKWEKKAEQDKSRYQDEMKDYTPAKDPSGRGKKGKKQKKDPNAPKRSMSAYFLFSIDARPKVKAENPDASFGDVARMISDRFKKLSSKEKKFWDERAAQDKARYTREMEEYRA